jgi:hypothetical protein
VPARIPSAKVSISPITASAPTICDPDTEGANTRHCPRRHGEALVKARASFIAATSLPHHRLDRDG